jgi:hypothetical protein
MIKGIHGLFFTPRPEELCIFLRDKFGLPFTDTGDGWLIFDVPGGDVGCHPADKVSHAISFYCDNIYQTVAELKSRGVEFTTGISSQDWGLVTTIRMPGNVEVDLYEPKYKKRTQAKAAKKSPVRKVLGKPRRLTTRRKPTRK